MAPTANHFILAGILFSEPLTTLIAIPIMVSIALCSHLDKNLTIIAEHLWFICPTVCSIIDIVTPTWDAPLAFKLEVHFRPLPQTKRTALYSYHVERYMTGGT
jgi:hypothetical protein